MNSPNIGQVAIFGLNDCLYNSSAFCISNTHIFFQMKKGAIKLAQIAYLLGHMKKVLFFCYFYWLVWGFWFGVGCHVSSKLE